MRHASKKSDSCTSQCKFGRKCKIACYMAWIVLPVVLYFAVGSISPWPLMRIYNKNNQNEDKIHEPNDDWEIKGKMLFAGDIIASTTCRPTAKITNDACDCDSTEKEINEMTLIFECPTLTTLCNDAFEKSMESSLTTANSTKLCTCVPDCYLFERLAHDQASQCIISSNLNKNEKYFKHLEKIPDTKISYRPVNLILAQNNTHKHRRLSSKNSSDRINSRRFKRGIRNGTKNFRHNVRSSKLMEKAADKIIHIELSSDKIENKTRKKREVKNKYGKVYSAISDSFWEIPVTQIIGDGIDDIKVQFAKPIMINTDSEIENDNIYLTTEWSKTTSQKNVKDAPHQFHGKYQDISLKKLESKPYNYRKPEHSLGNDSINPILPLSDNDELGILMKTSNQSSKKRSKNKKVFNYMYDTQRKFVAETPQETETFSPFNQNKQNNIENSSNEFFKRIYASTPQPVNDSSSYNQGKLISPKIFKNENLSELQSQQKIISSNGIHVNGTTRSKWVKLDQDEKIKMIMSHPKNSTKEIKEIKWNSTFVQTDLNVPQIMNETMTEKLTTFRFNLEDKRSDLRQDMINCQNQLHDQEKSNLNKTMLKGCQQNKKDINDFIPNEQMTKGEDLQQAGTIVRLSPSKWKLSNPYELKSEPQGSNLNIYNKQKTSSNSMRKLTNLNQENVKNFKLKVGTNSVASHPHDFFKDKLFSKTLSSKLQLPLNLKKYSKWDISHLGKPLLDNNMDSRPPDMFNMPADVIYINDKAATSRIVYQNDNNDTSSLQNSSLYKSRPMIVQSNLPIKSKMNASDNQPSTEQPFPGLELTAINPSNELNENFEKYYQVHSNFQCNNLTDLIPDELLSQIELNRIPIFLNLSDGVHKTKLNLLKEPKTIGKQSVLENFRLASSLAEDSLPRREITDDFNIEKGELGSMLNEINLKDTSNINGPKGESIGVNESKILTDSNLIQKSVKIRESENNEIKSLVKDTHMEQKYALQLPQDSYLKNNQNPTLSAEQLNEITLTEPSKNEVTNNYTNFLNDQHRLKKSKFEDTLGTLNHYLHINNSMLQNLDQRLFKIYGQPPILGKQLQILSNTKAKSPKKDIFGKNMNFVTVKSFDNKIIASGKETIPNLNGIVEVMDLNKLEKNSHSTNEFNSPSKDSRSILITDVFMPNLIGIVPNKLTANYVDDVQQKIRDQNNDRAIQSTYVVYDYDQNKSRVSFRNDNKTNSTSKLKYKLHNGKKNHSTFMNEHNTNSDNVKQYSGAVVRKPKQKLKYASTDNKYHLINPLIQAENKIKFNNHNNILNNAVSNFQIKKEKYVPPINITIAMKNLFNRVNPKDIVVSNSSALSSDGSYKFNIQLKGKQNKKQQYGLD